MLENIWQMGRDWRNHTIKRGSSYLSPVTVNLQTGGRLDQMEDGKENEQSESSGETSLVSCRQTCNLHEQT